MSRFVEICDEVVGLIQSATLPGVATVERVYVPEVDPDEMGTGDRRVLVFPIEDADGGPVSRAQDATLYTVGVVVAEKHTEAGRITNDWADERMTWVEDTVTRLVANARERSDGAYPETRETTAFDPELFANGVFWSVTEITFRDEAD